MKIGLAFQTDRTKTNLHLNIQHAHFPLLRHILHRLDAGPVVIPAELGVLEEAVLGYEPQEVISGGEIVFAAVDLACSWRAGGVCFFISNYVARQLVFLFLFYFVLGGRIDLCSWARLERKGEDPRK